MPNHYTPRQSEKFTFRLTPDTRRLLEAACAATEVNPSDFCRQAVEEAIQAALQAGRTP